MVFTSPAFLFYFLPLVVLTYYALPRRGRNLFLLVASYVFYGWWKPWFVLLMLLSTVVDYSCGRILTRPQASARTRKTALTVSIVANLSLLGVFKYAAFVAGNLTLSIPEIALPIGISFYTFQSMSYTIDLYRGDARPAASFIDFAAYVALFPQLIAGPIIRYRELAEQLRERSCTIDRIARGLARFALGFAKKLIIADNVAVIADAAFAADAPSWHVAWVGVVAYAMQIYFDFSGYSDMAIGLGALFGFEFPENFDAPYRSQSITEFWRRWHMSLSRWLRDYLYVPLGGNRGGPRRTYVNLGIVMLLGGLWHGAQWQFVVWGGLHGILLALERALGRRPLYAGLPRVGRVAATFTLVLITWVFFRAEGLAHALRYLGCMFGFGETTAATPLVAALAYRPFSIALLILSAAIVWFGRRSVDIVDATFAGPSLRPLAAVAIVGLFVLALLEMTVQSHSPFLYFQF